MVSFENIYFMPINNLPRHNKNSYPIDQLNIGRLRIYTILFKPTTLLPFSCNLRKDSLNRCNRHCSRHCILFSKNTYSIFIY
jgi:hypothetical protein